MTHTKTTNNTAHATLRALATAMATTTLMGAATAGTLEVLVLDKEGKPLPDAVIIVMPTVSGATKTALPLSATVTQEKMQFVPAVTVVGVGAKVRFSNNDAWDHHVRMTVPGTAASAAPNNGDGLSLRLEGRTPGKPASSAVASLPKIGMPPAFTRFTTASSNGDTKYFNVALPPRMNMPRTQFRSAFH